MSRRARVDPAPHLQAVAAVARRGGASDAVFAALDAALGAALGHKLFTIMRYHGDTGESERVYTNQPAAYPVGGRKALNRTDWSRQVIEQKQAYLGRTADDIKAVFFDWELIASLGCASVLNLPVVDGGRLLGTINLLHEARWYDDEDIAAGAPFAALAVPALGGRDA